MPEHPMPAADAEPIVERSSRKAQRSAAPPPSPPVFDDSELIELRKQVRELTSTNSNLELSVRKLTDANQLVLEEKDDLTDQVRRLNAQLKTLAVHHQAQLEDLRTKLHKVLAERDMAMRKLVDVGQELEALKVDCTELRQENSRVREQNKLFTAQVHQLHYDNDQLNVQMHTEMVLRSDYLRVQNESRAHKARGDQLAAEMEPLCSKVGDLEHKLEVARAEASKWKDVAKASQEELINLNKLLLPAGLSDKADLITLADLLSGPPKTYIQDVFDLLGLLKNGPATRTLAEAKKIIEIMNIVTPWTGDYLLRVRHLLNGQVNGPPVRSLEDLGYLLDHREDATAERAENDKVSVSCVSRGVGVRAVSRRVPVPVCTCVWILSLCCKEAAVEGAEIETVDVCLVCPDVYVWCVCVCVCMRV